MFVHLLVRLHAFYFSLVVRPLVHSCVRAFMHGCVRACIQQSTFLHLFVYSLVPQWLHSFVSAFLRRFSIRSFVNACLLGEQRFVLKICACIGPLCLQGPYKGLGQRKLVAYSFSTGAC